MLKFTMPMAMAAMLLSGCIGPIANVRTSQLSPAEVKAFEQVGEDELFGATRQKRLDCMQYAFPKPPFCQLPEPPLGYALDEAMAITWIREGLGDYTKTCAIFFVIRDRGEFEYVLVTENKYKGFNTREYDVTSKVLGVATWDRSGRPSLEKACGSPESY